MGGAEAQTQVPLSPGCCFPTREQPSTSSEAFSNPPAALCSNLQTWPGGASARFSCGRLPWTDGPGSRHARGPSQGKSCPSLSSPLPSSMVPRPNCGHDWPGTECHTRNVMSRTSAPSPGKVGRWRQRSAQAREGSAASRGEGVPIPILVLYSKLCSQRPENRCFLWAERAVCLHVFRTTAPAPAITPDTSQALGK